MSDYRDELPDKNEQNNSDSRESFDNELDRLYSVSDDAAATDNIDSLASGPDGEIRTALSREFEAADIFVSEELIARTLKAINALPAETEPAEKKTEAEIYPVSDYLKNRPAPTRGGTYSKRTSVARWITGIVAAVFIGVVGIAVVKNAGIKKSDKAVHSTAGISETTAEASSNGSSSKADYSTANVSKPAADVAEAAADATEAAASSVYGETNDITMSAAEADRAENGYYDANADIMTDYAEAPMTDMAESTDIGSGASYLLPESYENAFPNASKDYDTGYAPGTDEAAFDYSTEAVAADYTADGAADYAEDDVTADYATAATVDSTAAEGASDETPGLTGEVEPSNNNAQSVEGDAEGASNPEKPSVEAQPIEEEEANGSEHGYLIGSTDFIFMSEEELDEKLKDLLTRCEEAEADIEEVKKSDVLLQKFEPVITYYYMSQYGSKTKGIAFYETCLIYVDSDETGSVARCYRYLVSLDEMLGLI